VAFGIGGASTELTLVINADGTAAVKQLRNVDGSIRQVSARTQAWGRVAQQSSRIMMGIGVAAVGGFAVAIKEAGRFEAVMKDVELQSGASVKELKEIKRLALDREMVMLGKSGIQVGEMFKRLAAEGLGVVAMKNLLKPLTEATIVLGQDEAETTKLMLGVMEQYRIETRNASRITDAFGNALANTSFQGDELGAVLRYVGKDAAMAGLSLENTIVITDQIMKSFNDASRTGTGFRGLIASLKAPTDKMNKAFAGSSVSVDMLADALDDPIELVTLMNRAVAEGVNFYEAFERRTASVALTLADALVPRMKEQQEQMKNAGFGAEYAAEKMKTYEGSLAALVAAFSNLKQAIGVEVMPEIAEYMRGITLAIIETDNLAGKINTGLNIALGVGLVGGLYTAANMVAKFKATLIALGIISEATTIKLVALRAAALWPAAVVAGAGVAGVAISEAVRRREAAALTEAEERRMRGRARVPGPGPIVPPGRETFLGAPRGLRGLLGAGLGLRVADMDAEFEALFKVVQELRRGAKEGSDFERALGQIAGDLSTAKREAEGFTSQLAQQIETMIRTGVLGEEMGDKLLLALIPYNRALQERAALEQEMQNIVARAPAPPIDETHRWAQTVAELGQARASGTLAEEDLIIAQDRLNFAVEQGTLALEEQSIAYSVLQAAIKEFRTDQAGLEADRLKAIMPGETTLTPGGARMGMPGRISPGIEDQIRLAKELDAAVAEVMEDWPDLFGDATDEMGRDWDQLMDTMEQGFARGMARMIVEGEFRWKDMLKSMAEATIEAGILDFISGGSGGLLGKAVGFVKKIPIIGDIADIFFDNPVNDAWARREGTRFAQFFNEGAHRAEPRMRPSEHDESAPQVVNIQNYISAQPRNDRQLARELVKYTEMVSWGRAPRG